MEGATVASADPEAAKFNHFYEIILAFREAAPAPDGGNILVPAFLDAMKKFLRIFDALGLGSVGDIVNKDVDGNIMKLGKAAGKYGAGNLDEVLTAELADKAYAKQIRSESGPGKDSGTVALLWMKRVMQLIEGLVKNLIADPVMTLADASRKSYATNLRLCHPFITRNLFDTGLRFAPARNSFYEKLGGGNDHGKIEKALREFLEAMTPIVDRLTGLYKARELEPYIK